MGHNVGGYTAHDILIDTLQKGERGRFRGSSFETEWCSIAVMKCLTNSISDN